MGMEMSCAISNGVLHPHVPLEPLVQVAGLSDVDRNPIPVLGLSGVDVIARQRLESGIQGINLVWILLPGLARPFHQGR